MEDRKRREEDQRAREGLVGSVHAPMYISDMKPLTQEAYGGGMYGKDDGEDLREEEEEEEDKEQQQQQQGRMGKAPASETQSADGPAVHPPEPKHKPPPSTGDRDLDITGQSYIQ